MTYSFVSSPNCKVATRREKLTGATYTLTVFSEHEECRTCLDPGLLRRCCGNYYCDECFYSNPICRSCNTPINDAKHLRHISRAVWASVILGWSTTIFFILSIITAIILISINESKVPIGIYNYQCFGFFRTCNVNVCLAMNESVALGTAPLPPLSSYQFCSLNSLYKLEAPACVYDRQLYVSTDSHLGYDVCKSSFNQGTFIFEDNFENWKNSNNLSTNLMKSALWSNIANGKTSTDCGMNPLSRPDTPHGKYSLTFYGNSDRYAETKDMNVASGGWLEFDLLLAPLTYDALYPLCPANFAGNVFVYYSIDHGATWVQLFFYDSTIYRIQGFFHQQLVLPTAALTTQTRFKFEQPYYTAGRDGWALDNVKILRKLPSDWNMIDTFKTNVAYTLNRIQYAQCCFDTDWCQTRYSEEDMKSCSTNFPIWYDGINFQIRAIEIILLVAVLINIFKFIYVSFMNYLMRKKLPFQEEVEDLLKFDFILKYIPVRYRPNQRATTQADDAHMLARIKNDMRADLG